MHKSGTTLVSRLLHESGIHMGDFDQQLDYGAGNKFERMEAQAANMKIIDGLLVDSLTYFVRRYSEPNVDSAGHPRNRDSEAYVRKQALATRLAEPGVRDLVRPVIDACEHRHADWGFKDPRTCLTYPVWRDCLPEHRLIVVYRGLGQVLERSRARVRHPIRALRVLQNWAFYNQRILEIVESTEYPCLVLRYEQLMAADGGLKILSDFVGRPVKDARERRLYRTRSTTGPPAWSGWLRPLLSIDPEEIESQLGERSA